MNRLDSLKFEFIDLFETARTGLGRKTFAFGLRSLVLRPSFGAVVIDLCWVDIQFGKPS